MHFRHQEAILSTKTHHQNSHEKPSNTWRAWLFPKIPNVSKRQKEHDRERERNTNQWEWAERFPVHDSESGRDDHSRWWVPSRRRRVSTAQAKMPPLSGPSPTSSSGLCFWNRPKTQTTFSKRNCGSQWHISSVAGFDADDGILSTERENSLLEWTFSLSLGVSSFLEVWKCSMLVWVLSFLVSFRKWKQWWSRVRLIRKVSSGWGVKKGFCGGHNWRKDMSFSNNERRYGPFLNIYLNINNFYLTHV